MLYEIWGRSLPTFRNSLLPPISILGIAKKKKEAHHCGGIEKCVSFTFGVCLLCMRKQYIVKLIGRELHLNYSRTLDHAFDGAHLIGIGII